MTKIIIFRGNSGSGKSTITKNLESCLNKKVLVLEQDLFRHEFIHIPANKDGDKEINDLTIEMILLILKWANNKFDYIIFDGIFSNNRYTVMFEEVVKMFKDIYAYYFDLPFEETAKRHLTRAKSKLFTVEEMRSWLKPNNKSTVLNETILTQDMTIEQILDIVLADLGIKKN